MSITYLDVTGLDVTYVTDLSRCQQTLKTNVGVTAVSQDLKDQHWSDSIVSPDIKDQQQQQQQQQQKTATATAPRTKQESFLADFS